MPYLTVYADKYVLNANNNETQFSELRRFFEEAFDIKSQYGHVLNYLNFRICQSTLDFSIDQTDHVMELVNEWLPNINSRTVDTTFCTDTKYEK